MNVQRTEDDMMSLFTSPEIRDVTIRWLNNIISQDFVIVDNANPSADDGKMTLAADCQRIQTDSPDNEPVQKPNVKLVLNLLKMRIEAITCGNYCDGKSCHLDRNIVC